MYKDTNEINEILVDVMSLSGLIEYDEYVSLMCDEECISKMHQLKDRKVSLSLGFAQMKSYLLMKTNFREWFINNINEAQRQRFIEFIQNNKRLLLFKSIHSNDYISV